MIINCDAAPRFNSICLASSDKFPAIYRLGAREPVPDTLVMEKIPTRCRTSAYRQIVRAAYDNPSQITGQTDRDHVALDKLAYPNAGVELFGSDVDRCVAHIQFHDHFRIGEPKRLDDVQDGQVECDARDGKP